MIKIHEFSFGVYPQKLWVCYGTPAAVLNDYFDTDATGFFEDMHIGTAATTYVVQTNKPTEKAGVLIRFNKRENITYDVTTHESVHAAIELFDMIGEKVSYEHQEPFAYLAGFIADCCKHVKINKFQ